MNPIKVALVEDHDLTRIGLRMTLEQSNTVKIIGEAANGLEGLKLLERSRPDVAIVDVGLPLMDGIELIQRFKQSLSELEKTETPPPIVKVMMLTMHDDPEVVLAAFAAGADSYCMKYLNSNTLLEALQSTYEGNSWLDPAIAKIVLQYNNQFQALVPAATVGVDNKVPITRDRECDQLLESYPLTQRELEILELIVAGCSNSQIASQCYITVGTVKTHVRNVLNKLCVNDRTQAAVRALRAGLIV